MPWKGLPILLAFVHPCALPTVQKSGGAGVVSIIGDVASPFRLSASDAARLSKVHAQVRQPSDAGAINGDFEGVSIADLFEQAGAKAKSTKAGLVDSIIVARAALDDPSPLSAQYEVTLSYSEASPHFASRPAFLAFRCNGLPITPTLVVPNDLTDARYVHELVSLTLIVPK